jgi:hypothetical protein
MANTMETDSLGRLIQVYQESWKTDHEEVKRHLWRFEDMLAGGLALFRAIHDRYWTWRERVISGKEDYDRGEEQAIKERFNWWLVPCKDVLQKLEKLEAKYGVVEGGREFRRACDEAKQILKTWATPRPATKSTIPEVEVEKIPTHTNRALTMEEMAKELNEASQPTTQPSVPLKHKVDYSQVF